MELYDLAADVGETTDLSGDAKYAVSSVCGIMLLVRLTTHHWHCSGSCGNDRRSWL